MENESEPTTQPYIETGRNALREADEYIHQNPVPTVLTALAVGFVIGLLVRTSSTSAPVSKLEALREQLEESEENLRALLTGLSKAGKKKYRRSAAAVRDTVDRAVDAARDVDVDDYIEPASKWFRKLWK